MESIETQNCIVCGEAKEQGIRIVTEFICASCEAEIVRTGTEDDKYPFFVRQLRQLWVHFHA